MGKRLELPKLREAGAAWLVGCLWGVPGGWFFKCWQNWSWVRLSHRKAGAPRLRGGQGYGDAPDNPKTRN